MKKPNRTKKLQKRAGYSPFETISFQGRIGRRDYCIALVVIALIAIGATAAAEHFGPVMLGFISGIRTALWIVLASYTARRLHDVGRPTIDLAWTLGPILIFDLMMTRVGVVNPRAYAVVAAVVLFGGLTALIITCSKHSEPKNNVWGPAPSDYKKEQK